MRNKQVVIIGSGDDDSLENTVYQIGRYIAENNWVLITGGRGGVMEAASRGASDAGGVVIGIIPGSQFSDANAYCNIVIPTGLGYARNVINVLSGDVIVAIGGKAGTLSELAYAWQFGKPVINCLFAEGWSARLSDSTLDDRQGTVFTASSLEELFRTLDRLLTNP